MGMILTTPPSLTISPKEYTKVFMGGGIGECPDWQKDFIGERFVFNNPNAESKCGFGSTFSPL